MKKTALLAALVACLCQPLAASAVQYQVTVSGTLDSSFTGTFDSTYGYDLSNWLGKSYSMRFVFDNNPANTTGSGTYSWDEVPGNVDHWWQFNPGNAQLDIAGVTVFSGSDLNKNQISTMNDQFVPSSLPDLPPGVVADKNFDGLMMESGHFVGCQGAQCDWNSQTQIREELWIWADHVWDDTSAIPSNEMPDLLNNSTNFSFANAVYKSFAIDAGRWSQSGTSETAYSLRGSIDSVTIAATPVPEPETYAMLLVGLGMLGWKARRRG
ncbi:PEP-CTERM sorting domain-containing protein [Dechloromonas sp.]|uniref:PEP-CTERM sorting domain-containing protein n=1 Tax=Dechloromonas sp. TaxID=1917218 RepID=UPI00286DAF08|nr:PEP-CTERM sorting domain-containing protein [Dechloromonas sp.]